MNTPIKIDLITDKDKSQQSLQRIDTSMDNTDNTPRDMNKQKLMTQMTILDTQGGNGDEDDGFLVSNRYKTNKLITDSYKGENVLSDKLQARKVDFASVPNFHAKGARNLGKMLTEEEVLPSAR